MSGETPFDPSILQPTPNNEPVEETKTDDADDYSEDTGWKASNPEDQRALDNALHILKQMPKEDLLAMLTPEQQERYRQAMEKRNSNS